MKSARLFFRRIFYLPPQFLIGTAGLLADVCNWEWAADKCDQVFEELVRRAG
jgi:hypothetical protein